MTDFQVLEGLHTWWYSQVFCFAQNTLHIRNDLDQLRLRRVGCKRGIIVELAHQVVGLGHFAGQVGRRTQIRCGCNSRRLSSCRRFIFTAGRDQKRENNDGGEYCFFHYRIHFKKNEGRNKSVPTNSNRKVEADYLLTSTYVPPSVTLAAKRPSAVRSPGTSSHEEPFQCR